MIEIIALFYDMQLSNNRSMHCFYCEAEPPAGGVRITAPPAVAVCTQCGAGICAHHSRRLPGEAVQPILCTACAQSVSVEEKR